MSSGMNVVVKKARKCYRGQKNLKRVERKVSKASL